MLSPMASPLRMNSRREEIESDVMLATKISSQVMIGYPKPVFRKF